MSQLVFLDTGPLVALLDKRDQYHEWATTVADRFPPPWQTCEPVVTEACYLLRTLPEAVQALLQVFRQRLLTIHLRLDQEHERVAFLMRRYVDVRMSLADACLVRMSEKVSDSAVLTLDNDFRIYRRHGR